jgi:hypothetical protein
MTMWVLHEPLTLEDEQRIYDRTHLTLPFDNLPDLSLVRSNVECQHLLRALYPYYPPETIALKADRIWQHFSGLQLDDTVAVPLPLTGKVALGKISGPYVYKVDESNEDVHQIPVTWYPGPHLIQSFGRNRSMFRNNTVPLYTINDQPSRRSIQEKLPYKYNRFVRFKWVWVIIFILAVVRTYSHLFGSGQ